MKKHCFLVIFTVFYHFFWSKIGLFADLSEKPLIYDSSFFLLSPASKPLIPCDSSISHDRQVTANLGVLTRLTY